MMVCSYSPLQIKTTPLDAVGNQPGLINLLYDGVTLIVDGHSLFAVLSLFMLLIDF